MHEDPRTGPTESGFVTITPADTTTPQTAITIPSDALYKVTGLKIEYASVATSNTALNIYDDAPGTTSGNVSDQRDTYVNITPGSEISADGLEMRDFEKGVLVQAEPPAGGPLSVTVYGYLLTALEDVNGR